MHLFSDFVSLNGPNISLKDKINKLVGNRPSKKDISKTIQENRQKWEITHC